MGSVSGQTRIAMMNLSLSSAEKNLNFRSSLLNSKNAISDSCGVSSKCTTFLGDQFQRIFFSWVRHTRPLKKRAGHVVSPICVLPLTEENVERVLDEVRPSLMADGGNVALHEIDGLVVVLKLQGTCGSCPSSSTTLKMGIESRLQDKIPEIMAVEQFLEAEAGGLELYRESSVWRFNLWFLEDKRRRRRSLLADLEVEFHHKHIQLLFYDIHKPLFSMFK